MCVNVTTPGYCCRQLGLDPATDPLSNHTGLSHDRCRSWSIYQLTSVPEWLRIKSSALQRSPLPELASWSNPSGEEAERHSWLGCAWEPSTTAAGWTQQGANRLSRWASTASATQPYHHLAEVWLGNTSLDYLPHSLPLLLIAHRITLRLSNMAYKTLHDLALSAFLSWKKFLS